MRACAPRASSRGASTRSATEAEGASIDRRGPLDVQALALLATAWDRRLMFTVGQSTTTGEEDTVTWNEIHQKTQMHGGAHGYPDPSYLDRLLAELADHGVLPPDTPAGARPPPPPQQSLLVPKQEPLSPPKQE